MSASCEHQERKDEEWQKQAEVMREIFAYGMQQYANKFENFLSAFESKNQTLCCIDEGVPFGNIRSAGSGVLAEGDHRTEFLRNLKNAGVTDVKSHAGCGAAALYKEKLGITDKTVDEVAVEIATAIAKELEVPYSGHVEDLARPKEFHNARVVYFDGTGTFNPSGLELIPQGFVVSRRYMTPEHAFSEANIAVSIAFGSHGYGEKFTQDEPLLLVVIGENEGEFSTDCLRCEIESILEGLKEKPVKIDHWTRT